MEKQTQTLKVPVDSFYGTGKRKNAIAKVWLFPGTGQIIVNKKSLEDNLKSETLTKIAKQSLSLLEINTKVDIIISTSGGGLVGQAYAIRHGISRALEKFNSEFRKDLKKAGFLTRDPRVKERKKYGRKKARKGFQYRKR